MSMDNNLVTINPKKVTITLGIITAILVILSVIGHVCEHFTNLGSSHAFNRINGFFYVDNEYNIPSLYSALLLLAASSILALIALLKKKQKGSDVFFWSILGLGFLYMGFDEAIQFHESLIHPVRNLFNSDGSGIFMVAWVIPAAIIVLILGLFFLKFLMHLPKNIMISFLIAGFVYVLGAVVIEGISGIYLADHGLLYEEQDFNYSMIVSLEELLEMAGVILFIRALLLFIKDNFKEVIFSFK